MRKGLLTTLLVLSFTHSNCQIEFQAALPQAFELIYIKEDYDKNIIIAGTRSSPQDFFVASMDSLGSILWLKCYADSSYDYLNSAAQTYDKGLIMVGASANSSLDWRFMAIKLDSLGNVQWSKAIPPSSSHSSGGNTVCATKDSCIVFDLYENYPMYLPRLVKLDNQGNFVWARGCTSNDQNLRFYTNHISVTEDNGFIVTGKIESNNFGGPSYFLVMKLDSLGETEWTRYIDNLDDDIGRHIISTKDNGYAFLGSSSDQNGSIYEKGVFVKLDSTGNVQWSIDLHNQYTNNLVFIISTQDGGFLIPYNGSVLKIDSLGAFVWSKRIGWEVFSFVQTSDAGYLALTEQQSSMVLKIDSTITPCCPLTQQPISLTNLNLNAISTSTFYMGSSSTGFIQPFLNQYTDSGGYSYCSNSLIPFGYEINSFGSTTICQGESVYLYNENNGCVNYQWQRNGNNINGATNYFINATASGLYTCVITNDFGSITTNSISITVNPAPNATIMAGDSIKFCLGDSVLLFTDSTSSSYLWMPGNYTTPAVYGFQPGLYSVTATNSYGCTATDSQNMYADSSGPIIPSPQLLTDSLLCYSAYLNITLPWQSNFNNYHFQWMMNGDSLYGEHQINYNGFIYNSGNHYYYCQVSNLCDTVNSDSINITVFPYIVPLITPLSSTNFCEGDSVVLMASNGVEYKWFVTGSGVPLDSANSLIVDSSGTYYVCALDTNGCLENSIFITVNAYSLPTLTFNLLSDSFCFSDYPILIDVSPVGGSLSGNAIDSSYFNPALASFGWNLFQYTYTDSNGCAAAIIDSIYVDICTSIIDYDNISIQIYPNPFSEQVTISNHLPFNLDLTVFAVDGRIMEELIISGKSSLNIHLELVAGIYILESKSPLFTKRFSIIKL